MALLCLVIFLAMAGDVIAQDGETGVISVSGSGTTNPSKLLWRVFDAVEERAGSPVRATYRAVGSSTGIAEFTSNSTMFGSADIPLPANTYQELQSRNEVVLQMPFVLGTVSVFAHQKDGLGPLKLSPCLLAKIFKRDILYWDDPEIKAQNPNLQVDPVTPITVVHRTDGSSSTAGFTEYLNKACSTVWTADLVGTTINWPAQTVGAAGSSGVTAETQADPFSITYLSSGHGLDAGLPEVELQNSDGIYLTSSAEGASQALLRATTVPMDYTQDMSGVDLIHLAGPTTWPITQLSYLFIRQDQSGNEVSGPLLKAVAMMLFSSEVQNELAQDYGLVGLPQARIVAATNSINSIKLGGAQEWVVSDSVPGARVISAKRKTWVSSQLSSLTSDVSAMSAAVDQHISMQVHGSGTTNPSTLLWDVMSMLEEQASRPLSITYRAVGSSTGQLEFIGQGNGYAPFTDFGSGDLPLSADQYQELTQAGHSVVQLPFLIGAVGIFHSIPAGMVGDEAIKLDGCLLARIFQANITTWDHPDILDQNPGLDRGAVAGAAITVYHRDLGSSSTAAVTGYLQKTCPEEWALGEGSKLDTWPESTVAVQGSSNMVAALRDNPFAIGYADVGYGWNAQLEEVQLKNKDGNFLTSKEADIPEAARIAVAQGIIPESSMRDFSGVSLLDQPGDKTFPIVLFSYIYVRQDIRYIGASGGVLVAMLNFLLSEDAHPYFAKHSFFPPPEEVAEVSRRGVTELTLAPDATVWEFEKSTATRPGVGSSPYVFSGKRQSYVNYQAGLMSNRVDALESTCTDLTAELEELRSQTDLAKALSIAAICISGVAFLGMVELLCVVLRGKQSCCGRNKSSTANANYADTSVPNGCFNSCVNDDPNATKFDTLNEVEMPPQSDSHGPK